MLFSYSSSGLCDLQGVRHGEIYGKTLPAPQPIRHSIRHPLPAHSRPSELRPGFSLSNPPAGFHPLPVLPLIPVSNPSSAVALPSPLLPYPGIPFGPFGFCGPTQDLHSLNLINSLNRAHSSAMEQQKMKTPINRNYLELAMLVCNTFRGKLFPCPHCRYVTDRRNNLKRHISTMHQTCDKLLECCGVSFSTKASLREHIMIFHHNGYSCPYCGRRFCRKALLKRHLSVHSGQKDYTCPNCDYATSHKSNLERHKRIHERLKLGEDGSLFGCADYSNHQMHSPDTTGNSAIDIDSKEDNCMDIDISDDESSDIDVTDDNLENDFAKVSKYPNYYPETISYADSKASIRSYYDSFARKTEHVTQSGRKSPVASKSETETAERNEYKHEASEPLDLQISQSS